MNNEQDKTINKVFEIEDPFADGVIRNEYCAYNMTQEQVESKIRELMSNPLVRKAMTDFMAQHRKQG